MKTKFILGTFLLLFSRGCDFYSTSLWIFQEGGLEAETNPLSQFLGIGWNGLLIANVIIVLIILALFYHYCFRYRPKMIEQGLFKNYREYASQLYYNSPNKFYQIFYRIPKNKSAFLAHTGYTLVYVLIIASLLATIHNLSQFYSLAYYDSFRAMVKRPLYVIYGLIIASAILVYTNLIRREFKAVTLNWF